MGGFFVCGAAITLIRADPLFMCWDRRRMACPFKSAPCYHSSRKPPHRAVFSFSELRSYHTGRVTSSSL